MPYIAKTRRQEVYESRMPITCGELNYFITDLCLEYIKDMGGASYTRYNEVIGVLECAKLEMYRRAVGPYEDKKIAENGDVY